MISKTPTYNLMVVLKETGLKADVLRVWERRYELPRPQRTAGGHRLYSEYDIAIVKWLKERQAEGLSISRAVQLWKDLVDAGQDPLEGASLPITTSPIPAIRANIEILRQNWLESCLAFDTLQAEQAMNQAFALYPVEKVCDGILRQGLSRIGELWYLGKVSSQQEHFASALAIRRIETLITAAPRPTRSQTVLVGCPFGELHTFPALMLSLFLQRRGVKVVYLGADIPLERMDDAIVSIHPDLVVLAAQQLVTAASLASMAPSLRERGIPLAYGGLIFNLHPELRKRIGATFLGESLETALDRIEQLILEPETFHQEIAADSQYRALVGLFRQARPLIEHALSVKLQKDGLQNEKIEEVNSFFGSKLAAALDLGDLALMENELDWIKGLLTSHRITADELLPYLTDYGNCIRAALGQEGAPITDWLNQFVSRYELSQQ
jgi:MerR family transcriptional regulator, light-induced transcriptional regulator